MVTETGVPYLDVPGVHVVAVEVERREVADRVEGEEDLDGAAHPRHDVVRKRAHAPAVVLPTDPLVTCKRNGI